MAFTTVRFFAFLHNYSLTNHLYIRNETLYFPVDYLLYNGTLFDLLCCVFAGLTLACLHREVFSLASSWQTASRLLLW